MLSINFHIAKGFNLYSKNNTKEEFLQDIKKNGKIENWRIRKMKTLILSESFKRLGKVKKSERIKYCGTFLTFLKNIETGKKKLETANFCRERLCSMCQWRKSIKVFYELSKVMDILEKENPDFVPIFLTLTLKNCEIEKLAETLDTIFRGWRLLFQRRKFERIIKGWFRSLEVTYNSTENTFHPHIHAILIVEKKYFKSDDFIKTEEWVQVWKDCLKIDYDPICDIRKVQKNKGKYKAVAEVAKYTLKDSDFLIKENKDLTDRLVDVLSSSLKGRRLYAFGGILKEIAKRLGITKIDNLDNTEISSEDKIREDVDKYIREVYRWSFNLRDYTKVKDPRLQEKIVSIISK